MARIAPTDTIQIRLLLIAPPPGVDFGIQSGDGNDYACLFVQRSGRGDVSFDLPLTVADTRKDGLPNFLGPFAQGAPASRFVYVDVGTYAGQKHTEWSRRMKVPLQGITWPLIRRVSNRTGSRLVARIPGTAKDGGPNCATVRLIGPWRVVRDGAA